MASEIGAYRLWQEGAVIAFSEPHCPFALSRALRKEKKGMKNHNAVSVCFAIACCLVSVAGGEATKKDETKQACHMHSQHTSETSHQAVVEEHGDRAMGFSSRTTTHHFVLALNGGAVEVTANNPKDMAIAEAIRSHLSQIAVTFAHGDFSSPMFVHDSIPPGVTTMRLLQANIQYKYEEIPSGARVRIQANDPLAIASIHDFLRFQIAEHQTGDSIVVRTSQ